MSLDNVLAVSTAVKPWNKHYMEDTKQTVQYPRFFLGMLGVWPILSRNLSTTKKYILALRIVAFLSLLSFMIIPPMVHVITREKDPRLKLTIFAPISFHLTNFLKYGCFLLRYKTLRQCVEHVENDWKSIVSERDRATMRSKASVGHRLMLVSCIFTWSSGISYHSIMPLLEGKTINEINDTVRPLAFPGFDIFFDFQLQPTYAIIFVTICAAAFVSYNVTSASCCFTAGFVGHACGLLQIVISQLEALVDSMEIYKNDDGLHHRQSLITQCHSRALRLSSGIEEFVREICFMEVVSSTMIMCTVEYYLVTDRSDSEVAITVTPLEQSDAKGARRATYFVAWFMATFNIWLFCYIGEVLKEQGRRVGEAAYMIDWYKLPYKSSKDLIAIIIMSNYCPPQITAGRIFELSIRSFGSILRMSLTYCNLLRAMTD